MLGWWPIFTGMPSVLWAQSIALSATTTCLRQMSFFLTLSLFPFCFYKWTPLTLMFSYRFSDWKLISRLVNTMEPDSKHHAVCSALPAVLLGPSLDLLFVLIEFICLPLASASLFFVRFREAIVLGESPPYCSTKQTAGFFNLLGSVLLTGWNLSLPLSHMLRVSVFCVSELIVGCLLSLYTLAPPVPWVKRWLDLHFYAMRPCHRLLPTHPRSIFF